MQKFLEHIRAKSDGEKKMYALVSAGAITFLILIGWIVGEFAVGSYKPIQEKGEPAAAHGPWEDLKDTFGPLFNGKEE
jgi:hypothetical protein